MARTAPLQRLERGRYLTTSVSLCVACHSELDWASVTVKPGTEGSARSLAEEGLPFVAAANITPDAETGAGTWTDDMLARAIREGIGHDGRTLFPMMPYPQFKYMADEGPGLDRRVSPIGATGSKIAAAAIHSIPAQSIHQRRAGTGHQTCAAAGQERSGRLMATISYASASVATAIHRLTIRARRFER